MDEQTAFVDPTNLNPELLAAISRTGICTDYYALCEQFPYKESIRSPKLPTKELLQEASTQIALKKEKGVGRLFGVTDLPAGYSLYFILQGSTVETEIIFPYRGQLITTTFAGLCYDISLFNKSINRLYPRPEPYSMKELISVFVRLREIMLKLGTMSI